MKSTRIFFAYLILTSYTLVILHGAIPHFHVNENGISLNRIFHQNLHAEISAIHHNTNADHVIIENEVIHSFKHLIDRLFHSSSDDNHLENYLIVDHRTEEFDILFFSEFHPSSQQSNYFFTSSTIFFPELIELPSLSHGASSTLRGPPSQA